MIKEAATWAAPTARRQNLRFCRPRSAKPTWKPKGLPTLNRKAGSADFEGRALRGWRFANSVCEPEPRASGLRERFSATRGVRIEDSPPRTRGRPKDGHGRKARPGRRDEGAAALSYIPKGDHICFLTAWARQRISPFAGLYFCPLCKADYTKLAKQTLQRRYL